jgi:DNA-binding winged helix-turn-helix (wHTH) protein
MLEHFDDVTIDRDSRQLWAGGADVRLSRKAFDLLAMLIERRPNAVSKADIRNRLWPDTFVSDSSLPSLVSEIRAAIRDQERTPPLVRTVHGFGYAFGSPDLSESPVQTGLTVAAPHGWLVGALADIALFEGGNVLGREGAGVILLQSTTISRRHARVTVEGQAAAVEDLGSKNGTFVNDRRVTASTPIVEGDQIRLGSLLFTFRLPQRDRSTETALSTSPLHP